jgi:hypothetical protein
VSACICSCVQSCMNFARARTGREREGDERFVIDRIPLLLLSCSYPPHPRISQYDLQAALIIVSAGNKRPLNCFDSMRSFPHGQGHKSSTVIHMPEPPQTTQPRWNNFSPFVSLLSPLASPHRGVKLCRFYADETRACSPCLCLPATIGSTSSRPCRGERENKEFISLLLFVGGWECGV